MIIYDKESLFSGPVKWVFDLIERAYDVDVDGHEDIKVKIGVGENCDIKISEVFYRDLLVKRQFRFTNYFDTLPLVQLEDGQPDYISSIFYLVNGFQEYDLPMDYRDKYGRLDFKHSLQYHFDVLKNDLVKSYCQKLLFQIDPNLKIPQKKSRIFLSHDIDSLYGSAKYDGIWALRRMKIADMLKLIVRTVISKPPWFNIDKVAKLENEYDIKACYYWIVENGRDHKGIKNGDYRFLSQKVQKHAKIAASFGNEMGLHKSTMPKSFEEECRSIPGVKSNRHHFLKINNPNDYYEMEKNHISSDSSIGFPYHPGFKNSFGMPFFPYDLERNGVFNVLEIPLQMMDGMYNITDKISSEQAYLDIIDFMEANRYNAILSILWHNSELTEFAYQWSFDCYKKLLKYLVDNDYECVLPSQLVNEYMNRGE